MPGPACRAIALKDLSLPQRLAADAQSNASRCSSRNPADAARLQRLEDTVEVASGGSFMLGL